MFTMKNNNTLMTNGVMAATLEKMTGKTDDRFYDYAVSILAGMVPGSKQSFMVGGKVVIVTREN